MTLDEAIRRLRTLDEPVPKPPRLPTAEEVAQAERDLGVTFHPDYRRFQLEASNVALGDLEPGLVLPGIEHPSLRDIVRDAKALGVPVSLLPFCEDNGDYFVMDSAGRVGLWDHQQRKASPAYDSLATWIVKEWISRADDGDGDEDDDED